MIHSLTTTKYSLQVTFIVASVSVRVNSMRNMQNHMQNKVSAKRRWVKFSTVPEVPRSL